MPCRAFGNRKTGLNHKSQPNWNSWLNCKTSSTHKRLNFRSRLRRRRSWNNPSQCWRKRFKLWSTTTSGTKWILRTVRKGLKRPKTSTKLSSMDSRWRLFRRNSRLTRRLSFVRLQSRASSS
jgi:hypothetical protein